MRWMIVLGVTGLLAACASQPEPQAASTEVPANGSSAVTDEDLAREAKGYKVVEKEGQTLYCRTEQTLGSRLPQNVCLTYSQLTETIRRTREVTDKMRQKGGGHCGGGMSCGN